MSNSETSFTFEVKPAEASQVDLLHRQFSQNNYSYPQHRRYQVQNNGDGVYLIAWNYETPIGGFLLWWSGPQDEAVSSRIDISRSAFLEGGLTIDEYRRKGVATAIIREAERLAKLRGCTHIGMEVSSNDNPDANGLYKKLGYVDWGYGDITISWTFMDADGNSRIDSEIVTFLQKPL